MIKDIIATSFDFINVIFKKQVVAQNKEHLEKLINYSIKFSGYNCDLNYIDVSLVTDMSRLFFGSYFNGDISKWNTSNVTNMRSMFEDSNFDGDISAWNTSKVTDMAGMFFRSYLKDNKFYIDISNWDVSSVKNMSYMFQNSNFTGDLSKWKPYSLEECEQMLKKCAAPQPYWLSFENEPHIGKSILAHDLSKSLEQKLINKKSNNKKVKI